MPRTRECWGEVFRTEENRSRALFWRKTSPWLRHSPPWGSAIPFSLDAIPLYSQGLSRAQGWGSTRVQVQSRQVFPHRCSQTRRLWQAPVPHRLFQALPPKKISLPVHYRLPQFTSKIFILSLTDYLRFYPQNVNFAPGNYLDCTGMKIQWATFTLSPICSFWP